MRKLWISFALLVLSELSYTQTTENIRLPAPEKQLGVLMSTGYNRAVLLELGFAYSQFSSVGLHPFSSTVFISNEVHFHHKITIAPKVGLWVSGGAGGLVMGVNLLYYTNFTQSMIVFRPEMGIGARGFKLTYGHNVSQANKQFDDLPISVFSITFCLGVKQLRSKHLKDN